MSPNMSDRELLEHLRLDVAVIKEKLPLLEKISNCLNNLKSNCRIRHEELERARHRRHERHEVRFSELETAQRMAHTFYEAHASWTNRHRALFWSSVVAVATSAQVLATVVIHFLSGH
ncbi:MAG: hypothetical protein WBG50_10445 [Desulfomonilaceae bacterium]